MILRKYQDRVVSRAVSALATHGNTLVISPTGSGKTIMLAALAGQVKAEKTLVLQHRDELVNQNMQKYMAINPKAWPALFTADAKSWSGSAIFAMVQTLARHTATIPKLGLLIVDEAHHTAANSYRRIIDAAKEKNPGIKIAGFTATPERGDKKGLRGVFSNVADQVTLKELIDLGHLVPPRALVVDVGKQDELSKVRRLASDYDMEQVKKIMDTKVINEEVVRHWREQAGDRKTIVFCSTIAHAEDVAAAFSREGVAAAVVTGETPDGERRRTIQRFKAGQIQIICNVAVFTEGFDEPLVSCIVLLRPCSHKSTMIQMIGRGLRPVNCKDHPGIIKRDCIVLDFGTSLLTHGDLNTMANLGPEGGDCDPGECPQKECGAPAYRLPDRRDNMGCGAMVPVGCRECPLCGFIFEKEGDDAGPSILDQVNLTEIDILNGSPFRWVDLFGNGMVMIASGFGSFSVVANPHGGPDWYAIGKPKESRNLQTISVGGKIQAFAQADDFLRQNETSESAMKGVAWMRQPLSDKQASLLYNLGYPEKDVCAMTKLTATAALNFQWNRSQIERILGV